MAADVAAPAMGSNFGLRIGLNSGQVIAGEIGSLPQSVTPAIGEQVG